MKKFAALPPPGHDQWDNIPGTIFVHLHVIAALVMNNNIVVVSKRAGGGCDSFWNLTICCCSSNHKKVLYDESQKLELFEQ